MCQKLLKSEITKTSSWGLLQKFKLGLIVMIQKSSSNPLWERPTSPYSKKVGQVRLNIKSTLVIFFKCTGTVQQEFFFSGQSGNQHFYCKVFQCLMEQSVENVQNSSRNMTAWITITIHWHTLLCQFLVKSMAVVPQPCYSIWPLVIFSCL